MLALAHRSSVCTTHAPDLRSRASKFALFLHRAQLRLHLCTHVTCCAFSTVCLRPQLLDLYRNSTRVDHSHKQPGVAQTHTDDAHLDGVPLHSVSFGVDHLDDLLQLLAHAFLLFNCEVGCLLHCDRGRVGLLRNF